MASLPEAKNFMFSSILAETRAKYFYNIDLKADEVLSMPISGGSRDTCLTILDSELGISKRDLKPYSKAEDSSYFVEKYPILVGMVDEESNMPVKACTGAQIVYKTKRQDTFVVVRYANKQVISYLSKAEFTQYPNEFDAVEVVRLGTNALQKYLSQLSS